MGYSKHIRAIQRVQPFLDRLVKAQSRVEWESDHPAEDAYRIREGIHASSARALTNGQPNEPYYSYALLQQKYVIRTAAGRVIAERKDVTPVVALREAHAAMTLPNVKDEMGVVGAAITHEAHRMHFPDAGECDLEAVYSWAKQNGYYMVVGEGITLTRDDPGGLGWKP